MPVLKFNQCDYNCRGNKDKHGSFRVYCRRVDPKCVVGNPPREPIISALTPAKDPWQMTKRELYQLAQTDAIFMQKFTQAQKQKGRGGALVKPPDYLIKHLEAYHNHQRLVEKALTEGKPVPSPVLLDYPEFAWYLTQQEYIQSWRQNPELRFKHAGTMLPAKQVDDKEIQAKHKYLVQQALSKGKPVSLKVLQDYPDLQRRQQ